MSHFLKIIRSLSFLYLICVYNTAVAQVTPVLTPFFSSMDTVAVSDGLGNPYTYAYPDQAFVLGDFDNDGDVDVFFSSDASSNVSSFAENLGGGNFAPIPPAPSVPYIFHFGLPIDINKDGNLDVVGIDYDSDRCIYQTGNGNGTFNPPVILRNYIKGVTLDTADYNNDGFADLVVGSAESSGNDQTVNLYISSLTGPVLSQAIPIPGTAITTGSDPDYDNHYEMATGDYNSDGFMDVGIIKYRDNNSSFTKYYVALNDGLGGFLPISLVSMPTSANVFPTHLKIVDYDNDGIQELVVLVASGLYSEDGVISSIYRGVNLKVVDFDQDGKKDFMVLTHGHHPHISSILGWVPHRVHWVQNITGGTYYRQEILTLSGNTRFDAQYLDIDLDGNIDIISRPKAGLGYPPNSIFWHKGDWKPTYQVSGDVWFDANLNDTFDSGEVGFSNVPVNSDGNQVSLTSSNGTFSFWTDTLDHNLTITPPPGWSISTDSTSYLVHFDNGNINPSDFDFGLSPDSIFPQAQIQSYGGNTLRCDTTSGLYLSITSYGPEISSVQMSYTLDTLLTLQSTSFTPDSIVGQTIYWTVDSVWINNPTQGFVITVNGPGAAYAGDHVLNQFEGLVYDSSNNLYETINESVHQLIRCSYDPNDKQVEPVGVISGTNLVPLGQDHTYRIRFQNTGNDTAYHIRIEDYIQSYLNPNSLQVIDASHPYSTTITGTKVEFYFDNINLPDSSTNFELSQGYIDFWVDQKDSSDNIFSWFFNNPQLEYYVYNRADIFFDYNNPITTNTAINQIYSCDTVEIEFVPASTSFIYPGDTLNAVNYEEYAQTFEWQVDGITIGTDSLLTWPTWADSIGEYTISLTTTNEICSKTSYINIDLLPIDIVNLTEQICASDSIFLGGNYQNTAGTYYDTLTNQLGYDSILVTALSVLPLPQTSISASSCNSYTSPTGNYIWTSSGTYYDTIPGTPCDTIVQVNLTINTNNTGIDTQVACDSFTWIDGNTYTSSNSSATYTVTNANGCDSVVTLDLTINYSNSGTDTQVACDSFTWIDGNTYTSTNNSATHTVTNANGCDSVVTLDLTINYSNSGTDTQVACDTFTWMDGNTYTASNNIATHTLTNAIGCDSIVTLDLTINYSTTGVDTQVACDSLTWIDGNTYTASNNSATHTLANASGCDSIVTLDLTINYPNTGTDTQVACDSFTWIDGNTYTSSNSSATYTVANTNGCDSLVTLDLTINYSNTGIDSQVACNSFTWIDGNTYTSSNNSAIHILTNASGCDSLVTLDLTINYSNTGTDTQVACDSFTWIDGNTYTSSNNSATHTLTNVNGCDSIVTLDLTINYSSTGTDTQAACESFTWIDGNTYTSSNNSATHTLTNANGCDSVVTLDLTISYANTGTDSQAACESFTWIDGNTYTSSNNSATHTLMNANGCDSVVTLDLTINNLDLSTSLVGLTISSNEVGAIYKWVDCSDNSLIPGQTGQSLVATVNGDYAVIVEKNNCTDTSSCVNINTVDLDLIPKPLDVSIYPNPSINGKFTIDFSGTISSVKIIDVAGRLVFQKIEGDLNQIDATYLESGKYTILISSERSVITKSIVVNKAL